MRRLLSIVLALAIVFSFAASVVAGPLKNNGYAPANETYGAVVGASIMKLPGNQNALTIKISIGDELVAETTVNINNNSAGEFNVGGYLVYVSTYGNDKIDYCFITYAPPPTEVVLPVAITPDSGTVVNNPGKGWVFMCNSTNGLPRDENVLELGTVAYHRLDWRAIEATEGNYNWSSLDSAIAYYKARGKQFAFRIMAVNTSSSQSSTPSWVFDAGADYFVYQINSRTSINIPVWNDPIFKEKVKNLAEAIAEKYDGNPDIAFIDVGTYGNWGEGHLWPFGGLQLTNAELQEHLSWYLDAFHETRLSCLWGVEQFDPTYEWAIDHGMALRRDGLMGNSNGGQIIPAFDKTPGIYEWYASYVAHSRNGPDGYWWDDQKFLDTLYYGRPTYQHSYWDSDPTTMYAEKPDLMRLTANLLGFHYVLNSASVPTIISKGQDYFVQLEWNNQGLAPIYIQANVVFALLDDDNNVVAKLMTEGTDPFSWKPFSIVAENAKFNVPSDVSDGSYTLAIGLFGDINDADPKFNIAIEGKLADDYRWYPLTEVNINDNGNIMRAPALAAPQYDVGYNTYPEWIDKFEVPEEETFVQY